VDWPLTHPLWTAGLSWNVYLPLPPCPGGKSLYCDLDGVHVADGERSYGMCLCSRCTCRRHDSQLVVLPCVTLERWRVLEPQHPVVDSWLPQHTRCAAGGSHKRIPPIASHKLRTSLPCPASDPVAYPLQRSCSSSACVLCAWRCSLGLANHLHGMPACDETTAGSGYFCWQ
jgi:hypothetical protein